MHPGRHPVLLESTCSPLHLGAPDSPAGPGMGPVEQGSTNKDVKWKPRGPK